MFLRPLCLLSQILVITDTAYIDDRPTDIIDRGGDAGQYLLAVYSSLGIADEQFDSMSIPNHTEVPSSSSVSASTTSSPGPSSTDGNVEGALPPEDPDPLKCHGVGGDIWMIHRDQAVCGRTILLTRRERERVSPHLDTMTLHLHATDNLQVFSRQR